MIKILTMTFYWTVCWNLAIAKPTQLETAAITINMEDYIDSKIEMNESDPSYVTINLLEFMKKMKISKAELKDWMAHGLMREIEMNISTMDGTEIYNNYEVQTKKKRAISKKRNKRFIFCLVAGALGVTTAIGAAGYLISELIDGDSDEASKISMKVPKDIFVNFEYLENEDLDYTQYIYDDD